jgi:DNA-binding MurR/RpiR family transcriptional regulator
VRRGAGNSQAQAAHGELLEAAVLGPLQAAYEELTRAEKKLATYVLARPDCLVLESASTIARHVGVSQMTVSRFLRKLGFEGLNGIRHRLKAGLYGPDGARLWSIDRRYEAFTRRRATRFGREESLNAELAAIRRTYEITATPQWKSTVESVATAERVIVSGLHMSRGLALELVSRLEYIRPGVQLADGKNGHYADVLANPARRIALLLIDFYRYDTATQRLARQAKAQGLDVIIFTDTFCVWAREVSDKVFGLPTSTGLFWHSTGAFSVLLNLLVDDVVARLGAKVEERLATILQAQKLFGQFAEDV